MYEEKLSFCSKMLLHLDPDIRPSDINYQNLKKTGLTLPAKSDIRPFLYLPEIEADNQIQFTAVLGRISELRQLFVPLFGCFGLILNLTVRFDLLIYFSKKCR